MAFFLVGSRIRALACAYNGQVKVTDNRLAVLVDEVPSLCLVHTAVLALGSIGHLRLPA